MSRHRASGLLIAAIIGGAIVIAGGATAAAVELGKSSPRPPAQVPAAQPASDQGLLGGNSSPAPTAALTAAPTAAPTQAPSYAPSAAPTGAPTAAPTGVPNQPGSGTGSGAVSLGSGVSLSVAAGWSVVNQTKTSVEVDPSDGSADLFVTAGQAQSSDVTTDLQDDVQGLSQNISDMQFGQASQDTVNGQNFQQVASASFTGTVSTQQGTNQIYGVVLEALNPSTGISEFAVLTAYSQSDLQSNADAADQMIGSTF